jgi:hypothetical protein
MSKAMRLMVLMRLRFWAARIAIAAVVSDLEEGGLSAKESRVANSLLAISRSSFAAKRSVERSSSAPAFIMACALSGFSVTQSSGILSPRFITMAFDTLTRPCESLPQTQKHHLPGGAPSLSSKDLEHIFMAYYPNSLLLPRTNSPPRPQPLPWFDSFATKLAPKP